MKQYSFYQFLIIKKKQKKLLLHTIIILLSDECQLKIVTGMIHSLFIKCKGLVWWDAVRVK